MLKVADNTGAKVLQVIHVFGGHKRKFGYTGDILNCVVKQALPTGQVKSGEIVKVVLVRARKEHKRKDGSYVRFSENAGVLIDLQFLNKLGEEIKKRLLETERCIYQTPPARDWR
jgi:large subunit ribosomal protein L14